jgi:D-glycero-alpha-D-manno-heptose-7-phosphate kinase
MLLTSRTPLRVSFFGGGTDYPEYFARARGAVIGMAIDKYVYVAALRLSNILDYRYRVSYSRMETVHRAEEIQHPVVRAVIRHYEVEEPLDISIMADLPSRSGLGSSSSFTVGFLNLVASLQDRRMTKLDLARAAVFVERELLAENVGVQDQYHATFGGLNRFDFEGARTRITPVQMTAQCQAALTDSLFLVYTGVTRFASATLDEQMEKTKSGKVDSDLSHLLKLTDQAVEVLEGTDPDRMLADFGAMLHEGWETKKRLSSKVSNPAIDALYDAARAAGALGGKLCGAGSGGFLLMLVPGDRQARFREAMAHTSVIPVGLDTLGATILGGRA